jgi:hypothetical protein
MLLAIYLLFDTIQMICQRAFVSHSYTDRCSLVNNIVQFLTLQRHAQRCLPRKAGPLRRHETHQGHRIATLPTQSGI